MNRTLRRGDIVLRWALAVLAVQMAWSPLTVQAAPTPQQAAYWWQDEVRTAAFAVSRAGTGRVARWPAMTVSAGSATLPLPLASSPITPDGKLDEPAWQKATTFPVGPIFDDWHLGPMTLQVSVCRDEKNVYLAIESPRDLTGLGALTPTAELLSIGGKPYRVGPGGNIPDSSIGRDGSRQVIELALPATGDVALTFPVETARRIEGKLPAGFDRLGLHQVAATGKRDGKFRSLWLDPIGVRLVRANWAARLTTSITDDGRVQLASAVIEPGKTTPAASENLTAKEDPAVYPYQWQTTAEGKTFTAQGFVYLESIAATLAEARKMATRSTALGSTKLAAAPSAEQIAALEAEARQTSPADRSAWRKLHNRARELRARLHLSMLDAPLLLVKQHPYFAAHIYDDYYTWHPGGGIYVLEEPFNPQPGAEPRAVIDSATNQTLGAGVYRDAELHWDAGRLLFAYKPDQSAMTSIYEIGVDGQGLRRLTASDKYHDITPAYLPDDRIVFTSTRPRALVPCFNSGVDTLHTMNGDGSDIQPISTNNVTEFDPAVLPDGRVVYGRWEYVDKTALYMQSLWTMLPDGRMEEALFANNLAKPTAVLDVQAVPHQQMVVASLTPHNGQAVGAIGMIDMTMGKNDLNAVFNFTPEYPIEMDQGLRVAPCDPWALSADDVLMSNNAISGHGIIELVDRRGNRELVYADAEISCFAPSLVKPRPRPTTVSPNPGREEPGKQQPGRFLLVDVYEGLEGVERGQIKQLRVVEETARISGLPPGGRWWNQAFLVSWQGAYIVKNILGVVPVEPDGSAYFEVPAGRAVYFEALDAEGREVQRMRTFVQAAPGVTRSCVGCHEDKKSAPLRPGSLPMAVLGEPVAPQDESWGSGYVDYPTMVQPILDKHCVRCHGGEEGMAKGLDFSGGWTWAFNISYETLLKHRMTGFLNCNNGSVHTSRRLKPRTIGSGGAPLAEVLIKKHPEMSRADRDLILAWMDTNSNYYGTWDYTPHATCGAIMATRGPLSAVMQKAGCTECHAAGHVGNDWVNLQTPEWSRILRAPMPKGKGSLGLAMCRERKARHGYPLVDQRVQPPDVLRQSIQPEWDDSGEPHETINSTDDPNYQAMLEIIRHARAEALARPRVDMPGAEVVAGECRMIVPVPVPDSPPKLAARVREDSAVELSWQRTAATIGLQYELHRGPAASFTPDESTQIGLTTAGRFLEMVTPVGMQYYALVVSSGTDRSKPVWTSLDVPAPPPPPTPTGLKAAALSGEVALRWQSTSGAGLRYSVYRTTGTTGEPRKLNSEPLVSLSFSDMDVTAGKQYVYTVRAVDRREQQSPASNPVDAVPLAEIKEPVFTVDFAEKPRAALLDGKTVEGRLHAGAQTADGALVLGETGFATFDQRPELGGGKALSVELWVKLDKESAMPVVIANGGFNTHGWFMQRYGGGWRWHLAPASCDGGRPPVVGRWTHLVGTFNGRIATLYQDGKAVASVDASPDRRPWTGPLVIGQYSAQAPQYQVHGRVRGVKIYNRALRAEEIAAAAKNVPQ